MLSPKNAVDAASSILDGPRVYERNRLEIIRQALKSDTPTVEMPDKAPDVMKHLAAKARTNILPLVLETFTQSLRVDGYRSAATPDTDLPPWETWLANGLSSRQIGVHRSAMAYGASYVIVTPGEPRARLQGASPLALTAVYEDPINDDYPMMGLYVDGPMLRLYDEEAVYFIGVEKVAPRAGLAPMWYQQQAPYGFTFIEAREHNMGVCPIVRFRDRKLLDGEDEFGIIEPLLPIQARIDETVFGLLTAQYFSAFKQRYIVGWIPQSEEDKLRASASQLWTFKDNPSQVNVGELTETDLTRYLTAKEAAMGDLAAVAQVPAQSLGIGGVKNISAEALASLQAGKDRKSDEIAESLGESWRQVLQLAAYAEGDFESAADTQAQVHWQDSTARSLAQTVDALGKMATMLGVPVRALWGRIPGITQTDVSEWERIADQADPLGGLSQLIDRQIGAGPSGIGGAPTGPEPSVTLPGSVPPVMPPYSS